jgi:hypothetical protein
VSGIVGTGPLVEPLIDRLLTDAVPAMAGRGTTAAVWEAVTAHRGHHRAWYGDLLGPLRVPASSVAEFVAALRPGDDSVRIVLAAERDDRAPDDGPGTPSNHPLEALRRARSLLLDNHRVELVGIEVPLADFLTPPDADEVPPPDAVRQATRRALEWLDFSVTAWLRVEAVPGWVPAFDILAEDAAENVALLLPRPAWAAEPAATATVLHALSERKLPFAVVGGVDRLVTHANGFGLLNVLCAVRGEVAGAGVDEVASVLAQTSLEPLAATARRITPAEAAAVRDLLPWIHAGGVRDVVEALELAGLIAPDAA